ncbi:hypothetical protein [Psychrobacter alimentarius]|uniref:hypothetical protein n=1 Tax=Psychrobacter alimentarius TaxID=261164 RepID=UPI0019183A83|nr:hypothetical protein [Psychrobacter alimentarius]
MYMIQFGAQSGSTQADKTIGSYHILLNKIFYQKQGESDYFKTLLFLSIVFRVSGKHQDFESEGAESLQKSASRNVYTIDFTIPQERWQNKTDVELRSYIAEGVRSCFDLLKQKAIELGEVIDEDKLERDFEYGMKQFMTLSLPELKGR